MANIAPFEIQSEHYDAWFEEHSAIYKEELAAVKSLMPHFHNAIEIGVGTGRFAAPLGIQKGLEPSAKMAAIARKRGIEIIPGSAEKMPLNDGVYDLVLMVTTICFVDDAAKVLTQIRRILEDNGTVIIGFVDKNTPLGRRYQKHKEESRFYKTARFFSTEEVLELLKNAGFEKCTTVQTLFGDDLKNMRGGLKQGYGEGAFVVIKCQKGALR
jgi:SAM-dependent methyltransferase